MSHKEIRQQLREYNTIYKETDAIYSKFARSSGLSDCAFWLMYSVREANGQCTQKELGDQWMLSKQTVNSALKGLERDGYLKLIPSETNRRSKYVALTDKGVKFARKNIDIVFELEELAFQQMSPLERVAMIESSRKFQELFLKEALRFVK